MKKISALILSLFVFSSLALAEPVNLPNLGKNATGTSLGGGHYGMDISGTISATNDANGSTGSAVPSKATFVGGTDGTNLRGLSVDSTGKLNINNISGTISLPTGAATEATLSTLNGKVTAVNTGAVVVSSSALPTGAATEATLSTLNGKVTAVNTGAVVVSSSALPTGASTEATLSTLNGKVPSNLTVTSTRLLVDPSGVTSPISAASLPLPTGASTEATLSTLNGKVTAVNTGAVVVSSSALPTGASTETTLSAINGKLAADFGASSASIRTAAQVGNATGAAAFAAGNSSAQTLRVVIATDQAAVSISAPVNTGASFQEDATVTTSAETFTAPSDGVEVLCQAPSSNSANVRIKLGGTASSTSGILLEPGRSETFKAGAVNVSYAAESGTQALYCQWSEKS